MERREPVYDVLPTDSGGRVLPLLEVFINSGLHGAQWPRETYAVVPYWELGTKIIITKNDTDLLGRPKHAEVILLNHLRREISAAGKVPSRLKVFINYSPCRECCDKIAKFVQQYDRQLQMEVVFSALYNIRRNSCRGHRHKPCLKYEHDMTVAGLRLLHREGVILRTFDERDWRELQEAIVNRQRMADCDGNEDSIMKQDLDEILGFKSPQCVAQSFVTPGNQVMIPGSQASTPHQQPPFHNLLTVVDAPDPAIDAESNDVMGTTPDAAPADTDTSSTTEAANELWVPHR
ncbi:hypothetical protein BaRGS_00033129 [Batillaria attramentaria]|uniref:Uncharacterized protein n=1 Tax=Batillaria attramentaria TaxID=370345 RepID=A0ABD0JLV2_9CAEN